jgi:hypothetical protein
LLIISLFAKILILNIQQPYQRWYSERHISTSATAAIQDKSQTIKSIKVGLSSAATIGGDFSSSSKAIATTTATAIMSASNQSFCNKASNNNIYNVHVNNNNNIQSKANNSILNPIVGNDVGQQHGTMKNNNVIMSMSQNDKFQLANTTSSLFSTKISFSDDNSVVVVGVSGSGGGGNGGGGNNNNNNGSNNSEIINEHMKDESNAAVVNYQNLENHHLMNFHEAKFDLANSKQQHISNNNNTNNNNHHQHHHHHHHQTRSNSNALSDASLPLDLCQVN